MKNIRLISLASLLACVYVLPLQATESTQGNETAQGDSRLNIEFIEPEKFTDIRPSNESRVRFRKHVLSSMEEYFDELANTLPAGQTLDVKVSDIDLAGDTRSPRVPIGSNMFDIRVVEDIYFPRIEFSYTLKNAAGEQLQSDDVNLKDMAFLSRAGVHRANRDAFSYERRMLEDWFGDTFEQQQK